MTEEACKWTESWDGGDWDTGCGQTFTFNAGDPSDNGCKFCMYCGKPLIEVPHTDPDYVEPEYCDPPDGA